MRAHDSIDVNVTREIEARILDAHDSSCSKIYYVTMPNKIGEALRGIISKRFALGVVEDHVTVCMGQCCRLI